MREFFKGWKRKIGVLTLVPACAFMTLWMRSYSFDDTVVLAEWQGPFVACSEISSIEGLVIVEYDDVDFPLHWIRAEFYSQPNRPGRRTLDDMFQGTLKLKYRFGSFATGSVAPPVWHVKRKRVWVIPHWFLVLPLALISTYLLLGRRERAKSDA